MSDPCYSCVCCRDDDVELFKEIGYRKEATMFPEEKFPRGVQMIDEQASGGHYDELFALARKGILFADHGGPGSEFGYYAGVSFGGVYHTVDTDGSWQPMVRVNDDGSINEGELEGVRWYQRHYAAVMEHIRNGKKEGEGDAQAERAD